MAWSATPHSALRIVVVPVVPVQPQFFALLVAVFAAKLALPGRRIGLFVEMLDRNRFAILDSSDIVKPVKISGTLTTPFALFIILVFDFPPITRAKT